MRKLSTILAGLLLSASASAAVLPSQFSQVSQSYTVKSKDTLSTIAKENGIADYSAIISLNPELKSNPDKLSLGQKLKLPITALKPNQQTNSLPKPASHIVQQGDTLWAIAKNEGTCVDEIYRLNPDLNNKAQLKIGQTLRVPNSQNTKLTLESQLEPHYLPIPTSANNYTPSRVHLTSARHLSGTRQASDINEIIYHITSSLEKSAENTFHDNSSVVSSHYIIYPDGSDVQIANLLDIANHCKGHNKKSIGIECVGVLKNDQNIVTLTPKQLERIAIMTAYLKQQFPQIQTYSPHFQYSTKLCPGAGNWIAIKQAIDTKDNYLAKK